MSKNTAGSVLLALVLAAAVFLVALGLMVIVGDFKLLGSLFMAFVVALACLVVAGLVLSRAEALGRALTEAWRKRAPAKVRVARSRR